MAFSLSVGSNLVHSPFQNRTRATNPLSHGAHFVGLSHHKPFLNGTLGVASVAVMTGAYPENSGKRKELILLQNIAAYMLLACGVVYLVSILKFSPCSALVIKRRMELLLSWEGLQKGKTFKELCMWIVM